MAFKLHVPNRKDGLKAISTRVFPINSNFHLGFPESGSATSAGRQLWQGALAEVRRYRSLARQGPKNVNKVTLACQRPV